MKTIRSKIFLGLLLMSGSLTSAYALLAYMNLFNTTYPSSPLNGPNNCQLCHAGYPGVSPSLNTLNSFGHAFDSNGYSFAAIQNLDSDGDGFSNLTEINAGTWPGDASSHPSTADTTPPSVNITSPTSTATYTASASPLNIGGTASDNVGVASVSWANSAGGSGTASGTNSWSASGIALQSGSNVITVTARDAAGNSSSGTLTVTYNPPPPADTTAPTLTITSPTSAATFTVSASPLNIGGTASDNVGVASVSWANSAGGSGTASGTNSWSASGIVLQSGSNVITVTARDAAGNSSATTLTVTYNALPPAGTTAPAITITTPKSGSTYATSSGTLDIKGIAFDDVAVTQVTWASAAGDSGTAKGTTDWSVSGIELRSGVNVITVTAHDAAGKAGTDILTINYTPPAGNQDDLSGMAMWIGKWFSITIARGDSDHQTTRGYLRIKSWDPLLALLHGTLFTQDQNGRWSATELAFSYTDGAPLDFLFSFNYARVTGFVGSLSAAMDESVLKDASFRAIGIVQGKGKKDDDDDSNKNSTSMRGSLVEESSVPEEIRQQ